eukprot:5820594-Pyramimonas_sp.AAC.1
MTRDEFASSARLSPRARARRIRLRNLGSTGPQTCSRPSDPIRMPRYSAQESTESTSAGSPNSSRT